MMKMAVMCVVVAALCACVHAVRVGMDSTSRGDPTIEAATSARNPTKTDVVRSVVFASRAKSLLKFIENENLLENYGELIASNIIDMLRQPLDWQCGTMFELVKVVKIEDANNMFSSETLQSCPILDEMEITRLAELMKWVEQTEYFGFGAKNEDDQVNLLYYRRFIKERILHHRDFETWCTQTDDLTSLELLRCSSLRRRERNHKNLALLDTATEKAVRLGPIAAIDQLKKEVPQLQNEESRDLGFKDCSSLKKWGIESLATVFKWVHGVEQSRIRMKSGDYVNSDIVTDNHNKYKVTMLLSVYIWLIAEVMLDHRDFSAWCKDTIDLKLLVVLKTRCEAFIEDETLSLDIDPTECLRNVNEAIHHCCKKRLANEGAALDCNKRRLDLMDVF